MRKITDWFWVEDVYNPVLVKQGWHSYQIVNHGGFYSISLSKSNGGIKEVESIAAGIDTFERAVELIKEYDADSYDNINPITLITIVALIPVAVWLISELT